MIKEWISADRSPTPTRTGAGGATLLRRVATVAAAAIASTLLAASAEAASWIRVTSEPQPHNTSEVGLERTADGVLHVLWSRDSGASEQVMHSAISASGKTVSGPQQVATTPNFVNSSVDLVAGPGGGLRAFFAGVFPSVSNNAIRTATAGSTGTVWSASATASALSGSTNASAGAGIGAVDDGGTPWSAWGDSSPSGGGLHVGVNPAGADLAFSPSCCERDPNLAVDASTGLVAVGWNRLNQGANALQVLVPFVSPVENAPNSGAVWLQQRIGLTGRIGAGGIYAAYGSGSNQFNARPALWRIGSSGANVVKTRRDAEHTTLAPAPGGRLWVAWEGKDRGNRIFATRTNPAATRFGAIVATKPPPGTDAIHRLNVEGSRGPLDVVALADRGGGDIAHWTARLRPGLTLAAKPKKVAAGKKVTFTVSDAGMPVQGAKVELSLGGKQPAKQTNAKGKAKIKVPGSTKPGRYEAIAGKGGYESAQLKIRVK
ncbi:MAG: hypothetical protein BroJett022_10340 [Actinomycetes bacterium]|nr:MAG: hypothetical protein BroJett022_10340 [Actinomycetes bacterium]